MVVVGGSVVVVDVALVGGVDVVPCVVGASVVDVVSESPRGVVAGCGLQAQSTKSDATSAIRVTP